MRNNRLGLTVIEVIIYLTVLVIAAYAGQRSFLYLFRGGLHVELKGDLESIRQNIRASVSCTNTLPTSPSVSCPAIGSPPLFIDLRLPSGIPFLNTGNPLGVRIGNWDIRAGCNWDPLTDRPVVTIERARIAGVVAGSLFFRRDPLTQQTHDWRSLFPPGEEPCNNVNVGGRFGGYIHRCAYNEAEIPQSSIPPFSSQPPRPGAPVNPFTLTQDCPVGFTPQVAFSFANFLCTNMFYQECSWHRDLPGLTYPVAAAQSPPHNSVTNPVDPIPVIGGTISLSGGNWKWRGCGTIVYACLAPM